MPRRVVHLDGEWVTVNFEDPVLVAQRTWAVVSARAVDEMTSHPPWRFSGLPPLPALLATVESGRFRQFRC